MRRRGADETGDTLIEIVLALVIIGVVIGAFVATFSTGATASSTHRAIVTADVVLRNYAEQTKHEARDCVAGGSFTMTYPGAVPDEFTIGPALGTSAACPPPDAPETIDLSVTMPNGNTREMSIEVRTP